MTKSTSTSGGERSETERAWADALANDVRNIMSGQVRALSAVDGNLLILLVNLSSLLVAKGVLSQDELKRVIEPYMSPQPGDLVELHKIKENMYQQFLKGVEVVTESLSRSEGT